MYWDTMTTENRPVAVRKISGADRWRAISMLAIFAGVGAGYWLLLPGIQSLIIPDGPGGKDGPWVIRPIVAIHAVSAGLLAALTVVFILVPLRKRWACEDAALGTRYDPLQGQSMLRVVLLLKGSLLMLVYAAGLAFYLFSWEIVGPDGILEHVPWATRKYAFQEVAMLEYIPDGERSDFLVRNGPWYAVTLKDARRIAFSLDNEGMTPEELVALTAMIADRTGLAWMKVPDARVR